MEDVTRSTAHFPAVLSGSASLQGALEPVRLEYVGAPQFIPPPGSLIVQKFGGSSVSDAQGIRRAAKRLAGARAAGYAVAAVVSAMGDTTDELLELAYSVTPHPRPQHLDALLTTGELTSMTLLVMALADLGVRARPFTGEQAGLITDNLHGHAHIVDVRPHRVRACLEQDEIAVVAGFQGRTRKKKRRTTLGRGGSDLTAVALAAGLGASICEIYTDVSGVHTADPRIVPTARKIEVLSSEEMLEFAASGAKVLHLRCVEYAQRFNVPIHVRSSFIEAPGTLVLPRLDNHRRDHHVRERPIVSRVTSTNAAVTITVVGIPPAAGAAARLFGDLAKSGLAVDMITRATRPASTGTADISFTLPASEAPQALAALDAARREIGFKDLDVHEGRGRVTVSGLGMRSNPEVISAFFAALSDARIPVELVQTSETSIAAMVAAERLEDAVTHLETAFGLRPAQVDQGAAGPGAIPGTA